MAVIGTFTPARDGGWVGTIRTLTIDAKVRLVPNDDRTSKKAPAFRVFMGNSRIGEAWEATTGGSSPKDFLRVRLDDPMLPGAIFAALFQLNDGSGAQLFWSRRNLKFVDANRSD
jgi:uncharacterized protein (DUF736 family)